MTVARFLGAVAMLAGLAACAGHEAPPLCLAGSSPATEVELVFGRNIGTRPGVSEADWQDFLATQVTPRFPAGFTVLDAAGQWRGDDGVIIQEPSKLVMIVILDGQDAAHVDAVRDAYKLRFRQESVLALTRPGCVSF